MTDEVAGRNCGGSRRLICALKRPAALFDASTGDTDLKDRIVQIREKLSSNPALSGGIAVGAIVIALLAIFYDLRGGHSSRPPANAGAGADKNFYSADNGETYFEDDAGKIPPFDYNGQPAYRAAVFQCGHKKFVGYLIRYDPDTKAKIQQALVGHEQDAMYKLSLLSGISGSEIKKPLAGDDAWVKLADERAAEVLQVKCPDNSNGQPLVVLP
jgi:hypothetical protein